MRLYIIPLVIAGFAVATGVCRTYTCKKITVLPDKKEQSKAGKTNKAGSVIQKSATVVAENKVRDFSMEKSLYRIKGYIKGLEEDNLSLKEKATQLGDALDAKLKELSDLDKTNASLKESLDKANKAQDELRAEFEGSLQSYKQQLSQKEADSSALSALKVNLENQIAGLNKKLLELISVNSYLEQQIAQNQQERSGLTSELSAVKEELNRQAFINESLDKKVGELNNSLSVSESGRQELAKKIEAAQENISALKIEIEELKQIRQNNEQKVTELNAKISDLNLSGESMRSRVSELSDLLSRKEIEIGNKVRELSGLKEGLEKAGKEKDALNLVLNKKEEKLAELNDAILSAKRQMAELKRELRNATERQKKTAEQLSKAFNGTGAPAAEVNRVMAANKVLQEKIIGIYQELELMRAEEKLKGTRE